MAVRSILVSILFLLVSKNQNCVFENSREKGSNESFHTLNTLIVLTNNALTFICFQVLRFSPNRKKRERERKNRGKKTKQKYERWIIKIPLSGENDALEHECCSSLHHRSTVLPKFTIWPWASRIKPTLKRFDRQTTQRERERDEGMAVAKTIGNRRKINKERMGTKGRGGGTPSRE